MDEAVFAKTYKLGSSYEVGFAPDGASLVSISRNVTLWEAARRKRIASAHPFSHPSRFSFSPDGRVLVVKNTAGDCVALDAATLEVVRELGGRRLGEGPGPIAVDEVFVEGSWSGHLLARSMSSNELVFHEHHVGTMVAQLVASPDRTLFAYELSVIGDGFRLKVCLRRWPFASNPPVELISDRRIDCLGLDEGERLAVGSGKRIEVVSTATGDVVATRDNDEYIREVVWRPGGNELVVVDRNRVTGYTPELTPRWRVELQYASSVAFSPDGSRMALGGWEGGVVGIRTS